MSDMYRTFSKQMCASVWGLSIILFHILLSFYLWFIFNPKFNSSGEFLVAEISTPLSVTFALGVVKWVIDVQGLIKSEPKVGVLYVVTLSLVSGALYAAIILVFWNFRLMEPSPEQLNSFFLLIDSALGGLFALFYNDMFGTSEVRDSEQP